MPRQKSAPKRGIKDPPTLASSPDDAKEGKEEAISTVSDGTDMTREADGGSVQNVHNVSKNAKRETELNADEGEKEMDVNALLSTLEKSHEATEKALTEAIRVTVLANEARAEKTRAGGVEKEKNGGKAMTINHEGERTIKYYPGELLVLGGTGATTTTTRENENEGNNNNTAAAAQQALLYSELLERHREQIQRQKEQQEQQLMRIQQQFHQQHVRQQLMQRLQQQQQAHGALSTINDDMPYAVALARQQGLVRQQMHAQQQHCALLQQQAKQQAMLANPELMLTNSTHPGALTYPFNAAAQKPEKGKRGRKKKPYIDPDTGLEPVCAFSQDGTCAFALACKKKGKPVKYSKLNLKVPASVGKYIGKFCCQTCYYRVKAANLNCAFFNEGCKFAAKCEEKGIPVKYAKLSYRVPKDHAVHPGEACCEACHYKIKTKGLTCAFTQNDTCVYHKNCVKRGVENIQFNKLKYIVPATHPLYPGQRICEPCHYHLKTKGERCAFHKDGTCAQLKRKDMYDEETEPLAYKVLSYRVPDFHPVFAGERCCDTCYRRCKAMGQQCAFAKEGSCTFAKSCQKKNIPLVYKQLKYRVPKMNPKFPGELCCEACHYKCKAQNEVCIFYATGECQHITNCERKGVKVQYKQLKYHVPKDNPQYAEYAGKTCCDSCYVRIRSIGKECAFVQDGLCAYSEIKTKSVKEGVEDEDAKAMEAFQPLTRRVPATHKRRAGSLCCKSCFEKCKAGVKIGFRVEDQLELDENANDATLAGGKRTEPEKTRLSNGVEKDATNTPPVTDSPRKKAKANAAGKKHNDTNNE